jgi:hypothetical protein
VRFDQGLFAEVLLQGNPQLVGYKIGSSGISW